MDQFMYTRRIHKFVILNQKNNNKQFLDKKMPRQITISLIKIMNWANTQQDTKLEVSFLSAHNKAYIAHKSVNGSYIDNTMLLNTSFKISFHDNDHKLICKVAILKEYRSKEVVGEAELDLEHLVNRKIVYVTFMDRDKVMEIHRVEDGQDDNGQNFEDQPIERDQQSQHNFLQQRYNFLDKITKREIELKKDFSQKVYNLLKDIKNGRANENLRKEIPERKIIRQNIQSNNYETPARQNQEKSDNAKKIESKLNQIEERIAIKSQINKQPASKQYKLMIDSIQAYGKKETNKQSHKQQGKEHYQQEEEEVVIPQKRVTKEIRSIYKY